MKERVFYLDLIRVIACMMIILMHSPMAGDNIIGMFAYGSSYFTMPAIGLFFAVSGSLLLPNLAPPILFLKKRLSKVVLPTLVWTFVYIVASGTYLNEDWSHIIKSVCSIPFHWQGHGVLWFMYTIIGLYLITPVISPWLENVDRKTLQIYLGIWCVTLLFPILRQFLEVEESAFGLLYYMSGFAGYFMLGFYLRKFGCNIKWWIALLILGGMMILPVITKTFLPQFDTTHVFYYLSIVSLVMVLLWWNILKPFGEKLQARPRIVSVISEISKMSFGIYLSHILVMKYFLCRTPFILGIDNYIVQTFTITILTIIGAMVLTYVIGFLPYGEYLIGYKHGKGDKN